MEVSRTEYPLTSLHQPALRIAPIVSTTFPLTIKAVSSALDLLPRQLIAAQPWPAFSYQPEVSFSMAYDPSHIYLKYFVTEKTIQAWYNKTNDPVYKDSCVEFFVAFNNDDDYYNLEFNSLGTCRAGFGPNQDNRTLLEPEQINLIKRDVLLISPSSYNSFKNYHWQLTLGIPLPVFSHYSLRSLEGVSIRCNFFKCGDELPQPHFMAWNNITAPEPNFHLPAFFGTVLFV
jgi:hypothetical protein